MHKFANPWTDSLGFAGAELIAKYLRRATFNGQDLEARYYMSMGATLGMMSFTGTGGLFAHSISYVLAMFQPTAHGIGCGVGLPYTMSFNLPIIEDKLALIARSMGEKIDSLSAREGGKKAVELVYDLTKEVKLPGEPEGDGLPTRGRVQDGGDLHHQVSPAEQPPGHVQRRVPGHVRGHVVRGGVEGLRTLRVTGYEFRVKKSRSAKR